MKKINLIIILIIALFMVSSCNSNNEDTKTKEYINISTAGTGGLFYVLGNGIADVWSDNIEGLDVSVQSTAGSPQNLNYINLDESDVAFSQNGIALQAWNGEGAFEGNSIKNIRALTFLYPNLSYFVVSEKADINDFSNLKGKVLAPGSIGSGTEQNARELLKIADINYQDEGNAKVQYVDNAESSSMFVDGKVDMVYIAGGLGHASVVEMATSKDIKILPIEDELQKNILEEYPWYFPYTIPKDTYKGQVNPVETVAVGNLLIVDESMDENTVYNMMKFLYGNIDKLTNSYKGIEGLEPKDGLEGVTIPLHPGAVKFFEEKDIDIPDELKPEQVGTE